MTIKHRSLAKLGNALRDYYGTKFIGGKWFVPPQAMARERVERWVFRTYQAGYISAKDAATIRARLKERPVAPPAAPGSLPYGASDCT